MRGKYGGKKMNESIQQARDVALNILKPSQRDIEHGMELHKNSLVCESYGFSPRAAVDGDAVKAAVEAGASDLELQDLTEDMRMTRYVTEKTEREEFMAAWEAAGVTCILQNAGEEGNSPLRLIKRLARYTYVTDMMRDFVQKAVTPDDILAAKAQNRHCLYMSGNGVPLPQDWASVEEELRYIRIFFQLGIRMMHLTYNRRNMIGDGCAEPVDAGLSDFGSTVVAEMNRVGVIVDVAHCGWKTSLDAAKISERPMVASHSGCAALNPHYRCKPDEVIRAIVDTGGYIGICCIPRFLGSNGDINTMLDHIDYVVKHFGADHVTIGTDVAYTSSASNREHRKIPKRRNSRNRWEAFWHPNEFGPEWRQEHQVLSMAWTNWPVFTIGMVQRGYSDDDIQKILGGNVLRVARAVLTP
ncbi:membrane dipeptidase [Candidatus Poribacteria bacterium]|nr:membrane dipeptidase [Candidatus Poribacteria bacterium]